MKSETLQDVDWESVLATDPGIGVAIVTVDGEIVFGSQSALAIFGVDPSHDVQAMYIRDLFHPEFVGERMDWIQRVAQSGKPLRVRHVYQGRSLISTLTPLDNPHEVPHILVISRSASPNDPQSPIDEVVSERIDLGGLDQLSKRELEVLVLLGHGRSVPETARILHRSPRTIERHKEQIGRKLGTSTIAEIVKLVSGLGLTIDHTALTRYQALRPEFGVAQKSDARLSGSKDS
ncbi:MAG: helix-turn-helix transcriptional regulator [Pirellulaceae bacterium]|nr:helix-turn-helix transcriptional regulator [Pirellulaceae bacterium]